MAAPRRITILALCAFAGSAAAQQPAPPPAFAAANLNEAGARAMAAACAGCHGTEGRPIPDSVVHALAGAPREDIVRSMTLFRDGKKPATVMHQIAKGYSDAEIAALADYFSKRKR